jgi:hypothetical protein
MTDGLLGKVLLAGLGAAVAGEAASAIDPCDGSLKPVAGITIAAETTIADRRFGGISGIDFEPSSRRLLYVTDDRVTAQDAIAFLSAELSVADPVSGLAPAATRPLLGLSTTDGMDVEALRIDPRTDDWWIASEGGAEPAAPPWIGRFDRQGQLRSRITLPRPLDTLPHNRSIEALAFDAQGYLWVALENALPIDGPQGNSERGADLRVVRVQIGDQPVVSGRATAVIEESLMYRTEPAEIGEGGESDIGISEMLRVGDAWWVMERAGLLGKDGRYRFRSRLFCAARDQSSDGRLRKTLLLDSARLVEPLEANFEAMTIIPRDGLPPLLVIVNDNNFAPGVATRVLLWEISRR